MYNPNAENREPSYLADGVVRATTHVDIQGYLLVTSKALRKAAVQGKQALTTTKACLAYYQW